MKNKGKIYIKPVGGLCNRMRAIDSCVTLAKRSNKNVIVIWTRDRFLNCKFYNLFEESPFYQVIEEQQLLGKKLPYPYLPGSRPVSLFKKSLFYLTKRILEIKSEVWFEELNESIEQLRPDVEQGRIMNMRDFEERAYPLLSPLATKISNEGNFFICSAWRITATQNYSSLFIPQKELSQQVEIINNQFNNTIGIHIRRGDHNLSKRYSSFEKFKDVIKSELEADSSKSFFLSTDDIDTERSLIELYPEKIISYRKSSYNRESSKGIQDAVIDLFCLSRTKKIYGSFFSSFSQIATQISDIKEYTIR